MKLTDEDFFRLDEVGAFNAYSKTELVDGVIVTMNAQHARHVAVKSRLAVCLHAAGEPIEVGMFVEPADLMIETANLG